MIARHHEPEPSVSTAAGVGVALAGVVFVGAGLWGRREARTALARERVRYPGDASPAPVTSPARARSLAEFIRQSTVDATGGRTYAEIEPYLDANGSPTGEAAQAAKDERTGEPLSNPEAALWIQSTTLQSALMQAYMAFRLSEAMAGLGAALVAAGMGIAFAGGRGG